MIWLLFVVALLDDDDSVRLDRVSVWLVVVELAVVSDVELDVWENKPVILLPVCEFDWDDDESLVSTRLSP